MQPGRRLARQNRRTRRRTNRLCAVGRRETRALGGEPIQVRRAMFLAPVAGEVVDAEIVGEDEDDIRMRGGKWSRCRSSKFKAQSSKQAPNPKHQSPKFAMAGAIVWDLELGTYFEL